MSNMSFSRVRPGSSLKKLSNGDKVGVKLLKDRVVLTAEVLFVSELGDYNGITLRMTLEEARQLQSDLAATIANLEAQPAVSTEVNEN